MHCLGFSPRFIDYNLELPKKKRSERISAQCFLPRPCSETKAVGHRHGEDIPGYLMGLARGAACCPQPRALLLDQLLGEHKGIASAWWGNGCIFVFITWMETVQIPVQPQLLLVSEPPSTTAYAWCCAEPSNAFQLT